MAIAFVQQATEINRPSGGNGSTTITVTAGNLLVLTHHGVFDLTSVTDSQGNTWTKDKSQSSSNTGGLRAAIWSAPNCAGGSTTITANYSGASVYWCQLAEFSGVETSAYVDTSGQNTDDTTSAPTSTPSPGLSISSGSVAVIAAIFDRSPSPTPSTGYTALTTSSGATFAAYKIFSGAGSNERGAFNSAATHYEAVIGVYKAAGGGGGGGSALGRSLLLGVG